MKFFKNMKIKDIVTDHYNTIVLTEDGKLYSFGQNSFGELGHQDNSVYFEPTQISFFKDKWVSDVSLGKSHTLVLTLDGEIFMFGKYTEQFMIKKLSFKKKITTIGCHYHSLYFINDENELLMNDVKKLTSSSTKKLPFQVKEIKFYHSGTEFLTGKIEIL